MVLCLCFGLAACGTESKSEPEQTPAVDPVVLSDGWQLADGIMLSDEQRELFEKAAANMGNTTYEAVAYLGMKEVVPDGHNYCFLGTVDSSESEPHYALIYIFEDASGGLNVQLVSQIRPEMTY